MTQNTLSSKADSTCENQRNADQSEVLRTLTSHSEPYIAEDIENISGDQALAQGTEYPFADVKISTEKRAARERFILASVLIPKPVETVWKVVTAYEQLADFIPNLTSSQLVSNSEGRIRLEQIGAQCFLKFKFCARVVLDMTEHFPYEVGFSMVEGDFKHFEGAWKLHPTEVPDITQLSYHLSVKPPLAMPASLIEHHICHNLTANLLAIREQTISVAAG